MADPKTNEEVMHAVIELRKEVEKKVFSQDKVERIQTVLDGYEEKNQKLVLVEEQAKNHDKAIIELKAARDDYEKAGKETEKVQIELKQQVTDLEAEVARGIERKVSDDPEAYKEKPEYKAMNLLCKEGERALTPEQKVLLRTDSAVDGGFLVPSELDNVIMKKIVEIDPIRSIARVRTIAGKSLEMAIRTSIPTATYEGEAEEGGDSASTYESVTVTPYRQTHTVPITKDMLMDAAFDMDSEIADDSGEAFASGEGAGFVLGSGHKVPEGFMANAVILAAFRQGIGTSGEVSADDIILLSGDLKVGYNPVYVMNRRTLASIRTRKSTTGSFLWMPGLNGPVANTINGYNYVLANTMAEETANLFAVAFGDFRRGYTIVDRTGLSVIRDELTLKKKAIVEFTMNRWNTGIVTLTEAIKVLKTFAG